ncbi:hypothetical protein YH62_22690 [Rhizobium sp. LC145]|nr:hypothetical protein YH62_22690 [Rhizobium sp. LC145]
MSGSPPEALLGMAKWQLRNSRPLTYLDKMPSVTGRLLRNRLTSHQNVRTSEYVKRHLLKAIGKPAMTLEKMQKIKSEQIQARRHLSTEGRRQAKRKRR